MTRTKKAKTRPLNPRHHWWRRQKKKETKTHLVWKCRKCGNIETIVRGPGWLKPDMAYCTVLHRSALAAKAEKEIKERSKEDRIFAMAMKKYPSIVGQAVGSIDMTVFDKLDGSNIRAEWSMKRGFYKFGTRNRMIDQTDTHLGKAVLLVKEKYGPALTEIFKAKAKRAPMFQRGVVCFFEFFGPRSFAGQHAKDDRHDVVLFDISPNKAGILPPKDFLKLTKGLHIPDVLYKGRIGKEFIDSVRNSTLEGMTFEGVVCKAANPNRRVTSHPLMFKVKSNAWIEKLRENCDGDTELFERLK